MRTSEISPSLLDIGSPPRKICSLREIYENSNVTFLACEPQTFDEIVENEV